ncbi:hypothetical protein [Criibacterium bergeronii]|uniref:Uncharacterized protein n=1 Tax=Criibacterium bergeronii TaxID=1871336 RepID=A0A371IKX9_9FIRM|nr:hypothetical protein [Criibacterium bergeronii]MBS6062928.1 hypothetical protein [Peptostreptococcaceae bacterium]RDY21131.1 hypothetical protein BBG48_006280 [Criibacterium bergeronii]
MNLEMKDKLYSLLDFLDSLNKVQFLNPNLKDINDIKDIILRTMMQKEVNFKLDEVDTSKEKKIATYLYEILSTKEIFKGKKDFISFSEKIMNKEECNNLKTKKIEDMINMLIVFILSVEKNKQQEIFKTISEVLKKSSSIVNNKSNNSRKNKSSSNITNSHINAWLNYFDNYER